MNLKNISKNIEKVFEKKLTCIYDEEKTHSNKKRKLLHIEKGPLWKTKILWGKGIPKIQNKARMFTRYFLFNIVLEVPVSTTKEREKIKKISRL